MKNAATLNSFFSLNDRLISVGYVEFVEGRQTKRPHSSELYAGQDWRPISDAILRLPSAQQWTENGFINFTPNSSLMGKFLKAATHHVSDQKGPIIKIAKELRDQLTIELWSQHNHIGMFSIDEEAVVLQSDGMGNISGITTNGLHIDEGESWLSFRIGLNLGPIARRVIFSPKPLETLLKIVDMTHQDISSGFRTLYQALNGKDLEILAPKIEAGGAWCCTTAQRLHDGRRAVQDGQSIFVLLRAMRHETKEN